MCWDLPNNKSKHGSLSLLLSENQFDEYLQQIFPKLEGQRPNFFKLDTNRRPMLINISSPATLGQSLLQRWKKSQL